MLSQGSILSILRQNGCQATLNCILSVFDFETRCSYSALKKQKSILNSYSALNNKNKIPNNLIHKKSCQHTYQRNQVQIVNKTELDSPTSPAKRRGLKPRAEQGASRRTLSKLLGEKPFEFWTLSPLHWFLPGPFRAFRIFFLMSALLTYVLSFAFSLQLLARR